MTDHEDLIRRLSCPSRTEQRMTMWDNWRKAIAGGERGSWPRDSFEAMLDDIDEDRGEASTAIKELVAERDKLVSVVCEHVAKRKEHYDRSEKAEADLAVARAALREYAHWYGTVLDQVHAPAIAAARAEGGKND